MSEVLTDAGYAQTKAKLADLKHRLARLDQRSDLGESHLAGVRESYHRMMRQYLKEIKLYEAAHAAR